MFASTPSPQAVGETQIEMCGSQIDYTGEIAILSAAATATNQNAWIEVMEQTLEDPKYADMELVTTVYGDDDPTKSTEEAQGLLQAYPDLKCIIAPTTVGIAAAAQVVTQQDKCEAVIVTGLGLPSEMREFVKSGCVQQNALWNFQDIGYLAAYAAHAFWPGRSRERKERPSRQVGSGRSPSRPTGSSTPRSCSSLRRRTSTTTTSSRSGWGEAGARNAPAPPPFRMMPK